MRRSAVSPFANPGAASGYEAWYRTTGRQADRLVAFQERGQGRSPGPTLPCA